eukprot:PhF_6_TR25802/c0_g1_i3/m.36411
MSANPNPDSSLTSSSKLIIFDLHGVLLDRQKRKGRNEHGVRRCSVVSRPHMLATLKSLRAQYQIAVWTSSERHNAEEDLRLCFGGESDGYKAVISFVLTRTECTAAPTPEDKYATEKNLEKVWANPSLYGVWGPHNTILVDDTPSKGSSCPQNILVVPTFDRKNKDRDDVFRELGKFLSEEVRGAEDVREAVKKWVCPVMKKREREE